MSKSVKKNPRKSSFLYTGEGRNYLQDHFIKQGKSTYQIAEELDTYANMVRRALVYHDMGTRDKSEAQKNVLKSGRAKHPTEGTERSLETKNRIGDGVRKVWSEMSEDRLAELTAMAVTRWSKLTEAQKKDMQSKAAKAVRETAESGSLLERRTYAALIAAGYRVVFHKERFLGSTQMHIDIYLPEEGIAIEIDGPSHFYPIYGEETLAKRVAADNLKNGLLLSNGDIVIRVCDLSKFHSESATREFLNKLLPLIAELKTNAPKQAKDRYFELTFGEKIKWEKCNGKT